MAVQLHRIASYGSPIASYGSPIASYGSLIASYGSGYGCEGGFTGTPGFYRGGHQGTTGVFGQIRRLRPGGVGEGY